QQAAPERGEVAGQQAVDDEEAGTGRWRVNEQIDPAATGEPAKLVVAETDHYQSEPEDWDRPSDQREKANDEVGKAAAKDGRPRDARGSRGTARRASALLTYRGEIRPVHRAPDEPLHVGAQAEGFGRLIEDHVRAVVEHVVGDVLVRGRPLGRVRDERGLTTL